MRACARLKWTGSMFRLVIVRERVLFPFAIDRISVKPDIGMHRHLIVGQHTLVYAVPDRCCNG